MIDIVAPIACFLASLVVVYLMIVLEARINTRRRQGMDDMEKRLSPSAKATLDSFRDVFKHIGDRGP